MSYITEDWLQDVVEETQLPAVSPGVTKTILPVVEMQIRKILQHAHKFQRRGKRRKLDVEDINCALAANNYEQIYGLSRSEQLISTADNRTAASETVQLVDMAKLPLPQCPLQTEIALHWLAIDGTQPNIPENPSLLPDVEERPLALPIEFQHFYARVTGVILSPNSGNRQQLVASLVALETDTSLQDLLPFLSRFVYQQVRNFARVRVHVHVFVYVHACDVCAF